jgi:hypothetical protein
MVAPVAAAMVAIGGAGVLTASSTASPSAALYPVKVGLEDLQRAIALTPSEKIGIGLQIATTRLTEASFESRTGDLTGASTLLSEFDAELAATRAMVARSGVTTPASTLVLSVDREMALLESERNRVAGRSLMTAPAVEPSASPIALDPAKLIPSASVAHSPTTATADSTELRGTSDQLPVATAVAGTQLNQPTRVDDFDVGPSLGQSSQLVFLLLTQVREGDGDAALATARQYGAVLDSVSPSLGAADALRSERTSLAAALVDASPATRNALDLALSYVDDSLALGTAPVESGASPSLPVSNVPISAPSHSANPSPAPSSASAPGQKTLTGAANGVTGPSMPLSSGAPTHRPQTIGKPVLPVGGGLPLPITIPAPGGVTNAPRPILPVAHAPNPVMSMPIISRAPARLVPPKRVLGKSHGKIGK